MHASIVAVHNGRGVGGLGVKRIYAGGAATGGIPDIFGTWTAPRLGGTNAARPTGGTLNLEAETRPSGIPGIVESSGTFRQPRAGIGGELRREVSSSLEWSSGAAPVRFPACAGSLRAGSNQSDPMLSRAKINSTPGPAEALPDLTEVLAEVARTDLVSDGLGDSTAKVS